MASLPRPSQCIGGQDSVGDHVGRDFKRFVVDCLTRRGSTAGNQVELIAGQLSQADVSQADRQRHLGGKVQHLVSDREGNTFENQLDQKAEGD